MINHESPATAEPQSVLAPPWTPTVDAPGRLPRSLDAGGRGLRQLRAQRRGGRQGRGGDPGVHGGPQLVAVRW